MSPINSHYGGKGKKVWDAMHETYEDDDQAERIFYARENKLKKKKKRVKDLMK